MRKILILLAAALVTTQVVGCANCRRWLHRGSPCVGTRIAAPTMVSAPVAVGAPVPVPQMAPAPVMVQQPAPQVIIPQQPVVCCPQPVPCCPQPVPCCPQPTQCCPDPCCPQFGGNPCPGGTWFGGFVDGDGNCCDPMTSFDEGYLVPGTETPLDSGTYGTDPSPARDN